MTRLAASLLAPVLLGAALVAGCSSASRPSGGSGAAGITTTISSSNEGATDVSNTAATGTQPTTITYGADPNQFGQLWLPTGVTGPVPVVVLIHGGFWRAQYGLDLMDGLAKDLVGRGYAAWNIEYRRVGQDGGGYPGTLADVASAIDALATFGPARDLDLATVVLVGHSAGGQLSLWAAGRATLPAGAPGASPVVVPRLAIGEGPVVDLAAGDRMGLGSGAVTDFIGGSVDQYPDRYAIATPSVTAGVPLAVVQGSIDDIVPAEFTVPDPSGPQPVSLRVVSVDGADHFALIDPTSTAWKAVIDLIAGH